MKNPFSPFLTPRGPTVIAIQALLRRIGAPTAGTKHVLQNRLFQEVQRQTPVLGSPGQSMRLLSIDMGIKNLAFCVADVIRSKPSMPLRMQVTKWSRLDLTDQMLKDRVRKTTGLDAASDVDGDEADTFAPQSLANVAYWLVQHHFLQYQPDIILIERQRWRSSSSTAIQQWTVRVNSLEAMLWAALTTLRAQRHNLPEDRRVGLYKAFTLYSTDPKRVGMFWLHSEVEATKKSKKKAALEEEDLADNVDEADDESQTAASVVAPKKLGRTKAEKKAKIQLLRTWLNHEKPSTSLSATEKVVEGEPIHQPLINFDFPSPRRDESIDAGATRHLFLWATDPPHERRKTELPKAESKVDDLTDCFLQATAYVAWMQNRVELKKHFERFTADAKELADMLVEGGRAGMGVGSGAEATLKLVKSKDLKTRKTTVENSTEKETPAKT